MTETILQLLDLGTIATSLLVIVVAALVYFSKPSKNKIR